MKKHPALLVCIVIAVASVFMQACQNVKAIEYVKYDSEAEVPRISVEDSKKEVEAGNAIIIDTRGVNAFKSEHIAGSISLPAGSTEDQFKDLPPGKKYILYCSCSAEHTSVSMAFQMNQKGVAATYAMLGGTGAWKTAGFPMESGDAQTH